MRRRPRSFVVLFTPIVLAIALAQVPTGVAAAKTYNLPELLDLARKNNPGLAAGARATQKVEAQLSEANRSWMPTGEVVSLLAPVPEVRCEQIPGLNVKPSDYCIRTNVTETSTKFSGLFTRTELHLVQPVFTFGKITAGRNAATRGVAASKSQEQGLAADLALNVRRAYYGIKLGRAVLETFEEGIGYLDDAQKHVDKALADGTGDVTQTDRLRLKTVRAEIDVRRLETERLSGEARAGLRALVGQDAPAEIEVDAEPLDALEVPERPLAYYQEQARLQRPEVHALENLVAVKRSLADLERSKQYPDLVLLGSATYARANSIDDPQSAFANDPFNVASVGLAAAVRLPIDLGVRNARAAQAAAEAEETDLRRRDALGGITFDVARAYGALEEARKRLTAVRGGERAAQAWITAVKQNFDTGLAETKDFQDALVAFFQFRVRVLQAEFDLNIAAATLGRATGIEVTTPADGKSAAADRDDARASVHAGASDAEK